MDFASLVPGDTPFENLTKNPPAGRRSVQDHRRSTAPRKLRAGEERELPGDRGLAGRAPGQDHGQRGRQHDARAITRRPRRTRPTLSTTRAGSDALREFKEKAPERYRGEVTNSTYYFFLNDGVKPFDNARSARRSASRSTSGRSQRLFGGLLEPGCNFLPPGMQGYEKIDPCPYGDPKAAPDSRRRSR